MFSINQLSSHCQETSQWSELTKRHSMAWLRENRFQTVDTRAVLTEKAGPIPFGANAQTSDILCMRCVASMRVMFLQVNVNSIALCTIHVAVCVCVCVGVCSRIQALLIACKV